MSRNFVSICVDWWGSQFWSNSWQNGLKWMKNIRAWCRIFEVPHILCHLSTTRAFYSLQSTVWVLSNPTLWVSELTSISVSWGGQFWTYEWPNWLLCMKNDWSLCRIFEKSTIFPFMGHNVQLYGTICLAKSIEFILLLSSLGTLKYDLGLQSPVFLASAHFKLTTGVQNITTKLKNKVTMMKHPFIFC